MADLPSPPSPAATADALPAVKPVAAPAPTQKFWRPLRNEPPPRAVTLAIAASALLGAVTGLTLAIRDARSDETDVSAELRSAMPVSWPRSLEVTGPHAPPLVPTPAPAPSRSRSSEAPNLGVKAPGTAASFLGAANAPTDDTPSIAGRDQIVAIAESPPASIIADPAGTAMEEPLPGEPPPLEVAPMDRAPARAKVGNRTAAAAPPPPSAATSVARPKVGTPPPAPPVPEDDLLVPAFAAGDRPAPGLHVQAEPSHARASEPRPSEARAGDLIKLAEEAFQAGHSQEAVRIGKKALALGGGARANLILGGAFYDMRRFEDARAAYEAVLAVEPTNQAARVGLDLSRLAIGRRPDPTATTATARNQ